MSERLAVTGAAGFIGAYLCRKLVGLGHDVIAIDSLQRGSESRLRDVENDLTFVNLDIRDEASLILALEGVDGVFHLAAINGTENFYSVPELVLDVGIRGAISVLNACRAADVRNLVLASSAEVYQTPPEIPTSENVPLMLPNSTNPRFSYGGSKIASELIAFNYHREHFQKLQVFRPHNIYGPDMGAKHVIPQFILRALEAKQHSTKREIRLPIQGDGLETRAFCYVDDVVDGIVTMYESGGHREIFHIGNDEETRILDLVGIIGESLGITLVPEPSDIQEGSTRRRCPNIDRMRALGYKPQVDLRSGIARTADWYAQHFADIRFSELA